MSVGVSEGVRVNKDRSPQTHPYHPQERKKRVITPGSKRVCPLCFERESSVFRVKKCLLEFIMASSPQLSSLSSYLSVAIVS